MRQHHDLKIWPVYFEQVKAKKKTFEVRKNDRNFKKDDTVTLKEWDPTTEAYTGEELSFKIGYILNHSEYFKDPTNDYVCFSLLPDHQREPRTWWIEFTGDPRNDKENYKRYVSGEKFDPIGLSDEIVEVQEVIR